MAAGDVILTDGTISVNLHPGASVKRMLDKDEGLFIKHLSRKAVPKYRDYKKARDVFLVDAKFKNRFSDYQNIFNMVKNTPNATSFTFTWGTESFTVVVKRLIAETEPGGGTMRAIHCEMEVVTT